MYLYPTLTRKIEEKLDLKLYQPTFHFHSEVDPSNLEEISIKIDDTEDIMLVDDSRNWSVLHDDLVIKQKIVLENPDILFGDGGIISEGSKLGIAVHWYSRSSRQQGAVPIGYFSKKESRFEIEAEMEFDQKQFREKLTYSLILYAHEVEESTDIFADRTGYILGKLFETNITLEGKGSKFNIMCVEEENAPLWDLKCEWDDINESFEDTVRLKLNELHPDYRYLNKLDKNYNEIFFSEILISVVVQIIMKAVEYGQIEEIQNASNLDNDSIGSLISYYLNTYKINTASISDIYSSVVKKVRG